MMNMLGVWMWPYSIREKGAEAVMDVCRRAHVTDVFFLAKGLEGTTAFCRPFAPAVCERDLLQELLTAAHARGIRVHAWFTSACDEYYKNKYPESGRCHIWRGKDRELVSLADEGYLKYMEDIVRDVSSVLQSNTSNDIVHEMARDEARHGRGLEGLLKRYFK